MEMDSLSSGNGARQAQDNQSDSPQLCCIGGGKGGVGKSIVSLNVAHALGNDGHKVVLADMDLGGANLHTLVGHHSPKLTIREFLGGQVKDLSEILLPLKDLGFSLLPGSDEVAGVVQPGFFRKQKLLRHLRKLPTDIIICDLGGNSSLDTLDMFNESDLAMIVSTPEPTSVQNAYGFIKASILRKVWRATKRGSEERNILEQLWDPRSDEVHLSVEELISLARQRSPTTAELIHQAIKLSRVKLLVNMSSQQDARRTFTTLAGVTKKFLGLQIDYLGHVEEDERIHSRVMHGQAPLLGKKLFNPKLFQGLLNSFEPAMAVGINEEIRMGDQVLHIQTEDLGRSAAAYLALVYSGGRIIMSKRVTYDSPFMARLSSSSKKDRVRHLHRTVIEAIRSGRIQFKDALSGSGGSEKQGGQDHASAN